MKFKFSYRIVVIHEKSLVLFKLLRGADITNSGARILPSGRVLCIAGI